MKPWTNFLFLLALLAASTAAFAQRAELDIDKPPHLYRQRTPTDRFTRLKDRLESGQITLDRSTEKAFLIGLLDLLEIPVTSQLLVFSTTSLQLSVISPSNPRALYFNDDVYLGYVPGGRIEIVSVDPDLGGIFYLFDIPRDTAPIRIDRSDRCMNCHAGDDTGHVPGLVIKSVVPGVAGGSLTSYRRERTGHDIPLEQRFGGWYVTGLGGMTNHWGNVTGRFVEGELKTIPTPPGERFRYDRYPVATSDLLPHLLHEHQAGFVNRLVEAHYFTRALTNEVRGDLSAAQEAQLNERAEKITRYLLFADEASLPAGGAIGDPAFKADFLRTRRAAADGTSLRDFDLQTRLFKYRCSYMIYSPAFTGLPALMKQRIYQHLGSALDLKRSSPSFTYLPPDEKKAIRAILLATLTDLPASWAN